MENQINYKEFFTNIYNNNDWGTDENFKYYSGNGSHNENIINPLVTYINNFIKTNNITSILDFGCGDFNFGKQLNIDMYYGMDICEELIEYNKSLYYILGKRNAIIEKVFYFIIQSKKI